MIERMNETNEDCHRSILKLNLLVKYKITTHLSTHASIVYSYSFLRTTIQQKKRQKIGTSYVSRVVWKLDLRI